MDGKSGGLYAVALPFLAHSHFNAFLEISRMLATKGVTVIYVSLPSNLQFLRSRVQAGDDLPVYFQDLWVRESPLPPGSQNVNNISRDMLPMIFDLIHRMQEPLEGLMTELTGRDYYDSRGLLPPDRLVLIYDMFMGCSASVAAKFGVRSFMFNTTSVLSWVSAESMFWEEEKPLPEIAESLPEIAEASTRLQQAIPDFVLSHMRRHMDFTRRLAAGIMVNSFLELEPKFVRHLESFGAGGVSGESKPFWAVGPLMDLPQMEKIQRPRDSEIVEWLDRQTPGSVVYVSFGSESYISPAQVIELALGLEASAQPFLWVLRPPDSTLEEHSSSKAGEWKAEVLPEGYERRLGGRCLIETWWAPQAAILSHEATGAFITHCGWNSVLESVAAGVPMIALPLQSDQSANALVLAKDSKVAVEMKRSDGLAERHEVERHEVEKAVRRVMAADEMKRRVKAVSKAALAAISSEGTTWKNLGSFIQFSVE